MKPAVYYLPGHGGRITNGLGQALVARGYEVALAHFWCALMVKRKFSLRWLKAASRQVSGWLLGLKGRVGRALPSG